MRYLSLLVLLVGCDTRPDRSAELAACRLISTSGDDLARCLVMKYDWRAESAGPAKIAWQWQLDSIRLEHETQARVVLEEQQRRQDSVAAAHTWSARRCIYRYVEAYHSGTADTARARRNESYLDATIRICVGRFPRASAIFTGVFYDSLALAGVAPALERCRSLGIRSADCDTTSYMGWVP